MKTRNKKLYSPGEFECTKLQELFNKRKKKQSTKYLKKLDDVLLSLIWMAMYILGFMLFVSIFLERVGHTDFDPPEYLPLDLSSQSLFLEAVTRSRTKPKAKKKNTKKFPSIHKFTKKNQYNSTSGKFTIVPLVMPIQTRILRVLTGRLRGSHKKRS